MISKKPIILSAMLLGVLTACSIYKPYTRPQEVELATCTIDSLDADTTVLASIAWKEFFRDEHLRQLILKGLKGNSDLQIARLRLESTLASFKQSKLAYLPSFSLNPQGTVNRAQGNTMKTYDIGVNMSWEVDAFGRMTNEKRMAGAAAEGKLAYKQAVQCQLIATIAQTYYTLIDMDWQLIIQQRTLQNWEESILVSKGMQRNGLCDETAVLQATANKLALEISISQLKQLRKEAENGLCLILGTDYFPIVRSAQMEWLLPIEYTRSIPISQLANRPDVRQAESQLKQAFYAVNQACASFYPSLNLTGSLGWGNNAGGAIVNPSTWILNALGSLTQPLFSKGVNRANLKIAKNNQQEALIGFQQSILQAGKEVNDQLSRIQGLIEQRLSLENQIAVLNETVTKTQLLMKYGSHTYLEVLTAQQALLSAELNLSTNKYEQIKASIELYRALGGGVNSVVQTTADMQTMN